VHGTILQDGPGLIREQLNVPRILIVDDQASIRSFARAVLEETGLTEIDEAKDGEEGLAQLGRDSYALLISDWNMPRMDGLALLKAVRADARFKGLPAIMLTAEASREHVKEAIALGVAGFVAKPFQPETLIAAVRRVIAGAQA
jgi:two-component system chemotaxis response regulator CheY